MILKVTCPSCQKAYRLSPPYPPAGKRYRCTCSAVITVSYPPNLRRIADDDGPGPSTKQDAIPDALQKASAKGGVTMTSEVDRLLWTQTGEGQGDLARTREGASGVGSIDPTLARTQASADLTRTQLSEDLTQTEDAAMATTEMMIKVPPRPAPAEDLSRTQAAQPQESLLKTQRTTTHLDVPRHTEELEPDETTSALPLTPPSNAGHRGQWRAQSAQEPGAAAAEAPSLTPPSHDEGEAPPPEPPNSGEEPPKEKRRRPWWLWATAAVVLLGVLGAASVAGVFWYFGQNLPSVESLAEYRPPVVSRVYSADGQLIGEYFEEYRDVVQVAEMPEHVVNAFVAAEDASFFEHGGVDYLGIVRAALINLQEGRMAQGASTITQQVARSFLLSREKKLERKIREALLAYRVEANFPKERILFLYLNQIFLGEGAYGVAAGARIYFDKDIKDVTVAEAAILAGLPQAPSAYNPVRNWPSARDRQAYVLTQMVRNDMITEDEKALALSENVKLVGRVNRNKGPAASFSEHVRRMLVETYGHDAVYKEGLTVETTLDFALQEVAAEGIVEGCERTDQRIGYRGPVEKIDKAQIPTFLSTQWEELRLAEWKAKPGGEARNGPPPSAPPPLEAGSLIKGVLVEVHENWALVGIDKERQGWIALNEHTWLYVPNPKRNWKRRAQDDLKAILSVGDVIEFKVTEHTEARLKRLPNALLNRSDFADLTALRIWQSPQIEAALFSYRVTDGAVLAMVGGYDFSESEFNRVIQAKRQAGSTFKPFVYAAALDHPEKDYSPSTILLDAPLTMHKESSDENNIELWKPGNYGGDYKGEITMRRALILSRNTPTVRILEDIRVPYFYDYVKRLGFDSPLNKDLSMGLGSSSVTLFELSRAYSIFATLGKRIEPRFIDRVIDRDGTVLADNRDKVTAIDSMSPATAFVITDLLKDVVSMGTGTGARKLGKPVAGKTGTTNDFKDAWFQGFTPEVVTGVWTGYDQPQNMGYGQTGGDAAIPIWVHFMEEALKTYDNFDLKTPDKVVFATVDADSGLLATETTERRARVAFKEGTQPREYARSEGEVGTDDFFMMDAPF